MAGSSISSARWLSTRPPVSMALETTMIMGRGAVAMAPEPRTVSATGMIERRLAAREQLARLVVAVAGVLAIDLAG
jgi:hypothetical protein